MIRRSTMKRLGIITVTNSGVFTPTLLPSTVAFPGTINLPSPLRNHRLPNSIRFIESRTLLSFSYFSSSSAAYLPAIDEFSSNIGEAMVFHSLVSSHIGSGTG